jgi:hypothetical protein
MSEFLDSAAPLVRHVGHASATSRKQRTRFYWGMSAALLLTVSIGFAPTFYLRAYFDPSPMSTAVLIHGIVLSFWFVAFFMQNVLVSVRRVELHRTLGWGIALIGVGVVISGWDVTFSRVAEQTLMSRTAWSNFVSLVAFTIFLTLAIATRRNAETHKRLMLLASISIIQPALARVFRWPVFAGMDATPLELSVGASFLFVLALVIYDMRKFRKIHNVTLAGGLFFIVCKITGVFLLSGTQFGQAAMLWLA